MTHNHDEDRQHRLSRRTCEQWFATDGVHVSRQADDCRKLDHFPPCCSPQPLARPGKARKWVIVLAWHLQIRFMSTEASKSSQPGLNPSLQATGTKMRTDCAQAQLGTHPAHQEVCPDVLQVLLLGEPRRQTARRKPRPSPPPTHRGKLPGELAALLNISKPWALSPRKWAAPARGKLRENFPV